MIRELLQKLKLVIWVLPGFLLWASFPPMAEATDSLFAIAPLLWCARKWQPKKNFKLWFANGFFFWFFTLSWMPAISKNGGPMWLVVLGWLALTIYCSLYFATFGLLASYFWGWVRGDEIRKSRGYIWRLVGLFLIEPILWAGLELLRSRLMGGFAWNQLGVASINAGFGAPAILGGVYLVSALVILVNGTIASIAERMWKPQVSRLPSWTRSIETVLPFLAIWMIFAFANFVRDSREVVATRDFSVAMIQRNFPNVFEIERAKNENSIEEYSRLFATVAPLKPELVIASESALEEFATIGSSRAKQWASWVRDKTGASAVLAGGSRDAENGDMYNSAVLSFANREEIYDKVHLVPFGEFIPFSNTFPQLKALAPVGTCQPGKIKTLSFSDEIKLGVAICYEDTDSALIREFATRGANLLVFITNDSWFSHSNEAVQHSWQAVARAIETGLPIARVGNSGVTGSVTRDGKTTWLRNEKGEVMVDRAASMFDKLAIQIAPSRTPYVAIGDKPLIASFVAILLLIAFAIREQKKPIATIVLENQE